jgi:UPF0271 protein
MAIWKRRMSGKAFEGGAPKSLTIDLNCDCGEGFGPYRIGDDAGMLDIVTSASVACGFHAGDFDIMTDTFARARAKGVAIGAHPGFPDLWGFGRRALPFSLAQIERLVTYQIGAAAALATLVGHRLSYVKPHGALSNLAMADLTVARVIAKTVKAFSPDLRFLAIAGTKLEEAGHLEGLVTAREIYADRAYTDAGQLVSRAEPGAVLHDCDTIAERVLTMVQERAVPTVSGRKLPVDMDSICLHSDTPDAVHIARTLRERLESSGIILESFAPA